MKCYIIINNSYLIYVTCLHYMYACTFIQLILEVSTNHSSLLPDANVTKHTYSAQVTSINGVITIEALIDKSAVEVFGNEGEVVITSRAYPTLKESDGIVLFTENTSAMFTVDVWFMNNAYKSQKLYDQCTRNY